MYVCMCNGFTDKDVRISIHKDGATDVKSVHKSVGCKPQCGKCSCHIDKLIREELRG